MEVEQLITSGECGYNLTWRFEEDTLYIEGTGWMYEFDWSDYAREWDGVGKSIRRIVIREGCLHIGESAFEGLPVVELSIPDSIVSIEYEAFAGCTSLKSVIFPDAYIKLWGEPGDAACYLHPVKNRDAFVRTIFGGCDVYDRAKSWLDPSERRLEMRVRKKKGAPQATPFSRKFYFCQKTERVIVEEEGRYRYIGTWERMEWYSLSAKEVEKNDLKEISQKEAENILSGLILQNINPGRLEKLIDEFQKMEPDTNCWSSPIRSFFDFMGDNEYYGMFIDEWDEEKLVPKEMNAWQIGATFSRYYAEQDTPWFIRRTVSENDRRRILEMLFRLKELLSGSSA